MSDDQKPPGDPAGLAQRRLRGMRAAAKKDLLGRLLADRLVLVHVDARRAGVKVPKQFASAHDLLLKLSRRFANTNMVVDERGVTATLRFSSDPFRCVLPWSSIWEFVEPETSLHCLWEADLPQELGGPPLVQEADTDPRLPRLVSAEALPESDEQGEPAVGAEAVTEAPAPRPEEESKPRSPWLQIVR